MESILPQIQKIGGLIAPMLIGDQGEAAVIAFDSRIRVMQDFTSDSDKITKSVKDLRRHLREIARRFFQRQRSVGQFRKNPGAQAGEIDAR